MIPLTTYITDAAALYAEWQPTHPSMTMDDFYEFLCSPTPEREQFLSSFSVGRTVINDFVYLSI